MLLSQISLKIIVAKLFSYRELAKKSASHRWRCSRLPAQVPGECNLYRPDQHFYKYIIVRLPLQFRVFTSLENRYKKLITKKHHVLNNFCCNTPHPSQVSGAPSAFFANRNFPCAQSVPGTHQ